MKVYEDKIDGAPQFVSYFRPVLDTLRTLGRPAKPREVFASIADKYGIPDEIRDQVNSNGKPKFENSIAWARFYLTKAGLMYAPERGVWALTEAGLAADLSDEAAVALFKGVQTKFKGKEDDESAPEDEVVPDGTNYWFVGASWDNVDQTDRFVSDAIWANGYDDKFSKLVRQMKLGDRIAIKTSYVRKKDVPFENYGRPVSAMKIKAVGTITGVRDDGQTVDVNWEALDPAREWFLYTYRTTVVRARIEDDELARRLVAFTFENGEQDYAHFLKQPYWAEKFAIEAEPLSVIEGDTEATEDNSIAITYTVEDIIAEGGFMSTDALTNIMRRLGDKKNLILQGAPGTGKPLPSAVPRVCAYGQTAKLRAYTFRSHLSDRSRNRARGASFLRLRLKMAHDVSRPPFCLPTTETAPTTTTLCAFDAQLWCHLGAAVVQDYQP
nr:winged helix-turn-helix domain-containing protein [Pseudorhodobacter ferrugineus]